MLVYSGSNGEMLCGSVRGTSETFIAVGTTSLVDRPASTAFYTTVHSYSELDHDLSTQVPLLGARRGSSAHHKTHHAKRIVANSMRACRQRIITSRSRTHAPTDPCVAALHIATSSRQQLAQGRLSGQASVHGGVRLERGRDCMGRPCPSGRRGAAPPAAAADVRGAYRAVYCKLTTCLHMSGEVLSHSSERRAGLTTALPNLASDGTAVGRVRVGGASRGVERRVQSGWGTSVGARAPPSLCGRRDQRRRSAMPDTPSAPSASTPSF